MDESATNNLDAPYLDGVYSRPSHLVFIMGCHRSGTTFLHRLLADSGRFDFLSTYEVIAYSALLRNRVSGKEQEAKAALQAELLAEGPDRGIDHVPVDVDAPEEYGFILPGYDLFVPRLTEANQLLFDEICRKKRWLAGTDRPLLLKEPNEFYGNLLNVRRLYPEARFIINHRHPLVVLASHIDSWSSVYDEKNHYLYKLNPRYREIMDNPIERMHHRLFMHTGKAVELVLNHLVAAFDSFLAQRAELEDHRCFSLRYEDLCERPDAVYGRLMDFLGEPVSGSLGAKVNRRERVAPALIREVYTRNLHRMEPYLSAMDYPAFPEGC